MQDSKHSRAAVCDAATAKLRPKEGHQTPGKTGTAPITPLKRGPNPQDELDVSTPTTCRSTIVAGDDVTVERLEHAIKTTGMSRHRRTIVTDEMAA
jgi:hypothetical protein